MRVRDGHTWAKLWIAQVVKYVYILIEAIAGVVNEGNVSLRRIYQHNILKNL